jgi:hypothetical protein
MDAPPPYEANDSDSDNLYFDNDCNLIIDCLHTPIEFAKEMVKDIVGALEGCNFPLGISHLDEYTAESHNLDDEFGVYLMNCVQLAIHNHPKNPNKYRFGTTIVFTHLSIKLITQPICCR